MLEEEATNQLNVLIILAPNDQTKDELKLRCKQAGAELGQAQLKLGLDFN